MHVGVQGIGPSKMEQEFPGVGYGYGVCAIGAYIIGEIPMLTRIFLFVGISSLCLASARAQVTYETFEFLPLAVDVGLQGRLKRRIRPAGLRRTPLEVTVSERTEVIDGLTYYVFTLMEHTGTGEISLYRHAATLHDSGNEGDKQSGH